MSNRLGDRVSGGLLLAFALGVFAYTFAFPAPVQPLDPGVTAFPRIVAVLIGVLAVWLLVRPKEGETLPRAWPATRIVLTVLLLCGYAITLESLGFVITTVLFLLAELLLLGVRHPVYLLLLPLGLSMVLFYVFRVFLEVPLPVSPLGGLPI